MQASDIPSKFPIAFAKNAATGFIRAIPQTSADPNAASLSLGFPPNNFVPAAGGGAAPNGQDFNGILNQVSAWCQWQAAGLFVPYDSTFQTSIGGYPNGAVVASVVTAGVYWRSTADNNVTNPDTGGANWVRMTASSPAIGFLNLKGSAAGGTKTASWSADQITASTAPTSERLSHFRSMGRRPARTGWIRDRRPSAAISLSMRFSIRQHRRGHVSGRLPVLERRSTAAPTCRRVTPHPASSGRGRRTFQAISKSSSSRIVTSRLLWLNRSAAAEQLRGHLFH